MEPYKNIPAKRVAYTDLFGTTRIFKSDTEGRFGVFSDWIGIQWGIPWSYEDYRTADGEPILFTVDTDWYVKNHVPDFRWVINGEVVFVQIKPATGASESYLDTTLRKVAKELEALRIPLLLVCGNFKYQDEIIVDFYPYGSANSTITLRDYFQVGPAEKKDLERAIKRAKEWRFDLCQEGDYGKGAA